jgi:hypothetical protein
MRRLAAVLALSALAMAPTQASATTSHVWRHTQSGADALLPAPPFHDPLGPLIDVTARWTDFQPATVFCVRPDRFEASGPTGATSTGSDPACRRSGFRPGVRGLYKVDIRTPTLCAGCRRFFIDYSKIPAENAPPLYYAHGHAYFRLQSWNFTYTVDPIAHSPNVKNFTNDKLIAPTGSVAEDVATMFDLYSMAYVSDTKFFVHSQVQGPYYIGPWYLNRAGRRVVGAYLDLNVMNAQELPLSFLNEVRYMSGFRSGEPACLDGPLGYEDADAFYAGCVDQMGGSSAAIDPFR